MNHQKIKLSVLVTTLALSLTLTANAAVPKKIFKVDEPVPVIENAKPAVQHQHIHLGNFILTFYCPCPRCVGYKKIVRTATGTIPKANYTIAVDRRVIPLGSKVHIAGLGDFKAEDTGGAIKGNRIDVFVNSHRQALQLGRRSAKVYLIKETL